MGRVRQGGGNTIKHALLPWPLPWEMVPIPVGDAMRVHEGCASAFFL